MKISPNMTKLSRESGLILFNQDILYTHSYFLKVHFIMTHLLQNEYIISTNSQCVAKCTYAHILADR